MARIAYVLLCHKDPEAVIAQAERLTAAGDLIAIHHDAAAPRAEYDRIRVRLADNPSVVLVAQRRRCGWGDWSLVDATLRTLRAAERAFPQATHFYMLSGDCLPIKPADHARAFLDADDADHIETHDFFTSGWIRTGLREERLIYRHLFNERRRKRLFYLSLDVQRRIGLTRSLPADLDIRIGSQWWCLRRGTVERVLHFCATRPDVLRFFRRTWIPDETFFQTLVWHFVPAAQIRCRPLTFLMFTDYGMPVTFHDDHLDLLLRQDCLFARKISAGARQLRDRLGQIYAARDGTLTVCDDGRSQHRFLTGRGRVGRRFAPGAWDTGARLGSGRTLLILACKKWHVGKRLADRLRQGADLPGVDYLFHELDAGCPDLGGLETTLDKRNRHRRALIALLFDHWKADRMVLCVDPARTDLIADFRADRCETRVLEVVCTFTGDDLAGHARRVGLAGPLAPQDAIDPVLPALRLDLAEEGDRLRDAAPGAFHRIRQSSDDMENALSLAAFLGIPAARALEIAAPGTLFAD
jgi:hypothetical protein